MADDSNARDAFPSPPRDPYVGARASSISLLPSIQAALEELKEAEGRLIYAQHLLQQEYSRVFTAIRTVKTVVAHSIVLTPAAYHNLLDQVALTWPHGRAAASAAGGAGAGAGAAHTCVRRSVWTTGCAACKRDFDAGSVSVEDSD